MPQDRRIGSYTLRRVLGSGATGQVWEASGEDGKLWALKLLRSDLADDRSVVQRFIAERTVLLSVQDPHVVQMHDLVAEQGQLGIVMDLVEGGSLRQVLATRGTLAAGEVARLGEGIAHGLHALHAAGVIHRDIKPENILMGASGGAAVPRLTDFGIAKVLDASGASARSTALVGTPAYLAPELSDGEPPSPASDLYALGITLYECICGVSPFHGASPLAMLRQHADRLPGRPDGVPDSMWNVIAHLLAKSPAGRPQSAGWVAAVLEGLQSQLAATPPLPPLSSPPIGDYVSSGIPTHLDHSGDDTLVTGGSRGTESVAPNPRDPQHRGRRTAVLVGVVAVGLLAAGGTAYALTRPGGSPATASTGSPTTTTHASSTSSSAADRTSSSPDASRPETPTSTTVTPSAPATMPNVVGSTLADAENALPGIAVKTVDIVSEKRADGTVIGQTPAQGASLDGAVTLKIARQPVVQYLDQLDTTTANGNWFDTGPINSDKRAYPHALSVPFCQWGDNNLSSEEWNLGGHYQQLKATIGQDDNSPSSGESGLVQVFGDGRQLFSKTITFGTAVPLAVDVTDVLRLKVEVVESKCDDNDEGATMVLGDIRLLGLQSEVPMPTSDE